MENTRRIDNSSSLDYDSQSEKSKTQEKLTRKNKTSQAQNYTFNNLELSGKKKNSCFNDCNEKNCNYFRLLQAKEKETTKKHKQIRKFKFLFV